MNATVSYPSGPKKSRTDWLKLILIIFVTSSCHHDRGGVYSVSKGHFVQSVIETGELQAVNASYLGMPRINYIYGYQFKIIGLAGHGTNVHEGDTVISVDPSSVQKYIIEKTELLETEIASGNKLKAQITNNIQDLRSQLRNEQASWEIKKLAMEKSGFESNSIRKISVLEFRIEDIKLNKLKRNLQVRPKLDSLDMLIQEIKVKQKENELKAASETLSKMVVISPLDGIFVVNENWRTGQLIRVGDEVFLGNPVAMIPDISTMMVKGFILENDIGSIRQGMDVIIRLDALQSVAFHGRLTRLGKVCIEKDDKKIFPTEVLITESDPRLKPGMTVRCEYINFEGENVLYVANNLILEENGHFYLFPVKRGKPVRTEVTAGPSNNSCTVVSGDLKAGQTLVLPEKAETN